MSRIIKNTSLDKLKRSMISGGARTFAGDRLAEVISFWKISREELADLSSSFPFDSERYKWEYLYSDFPQSMTRCDESLFKCYERAAKKYAIRHMLGRIRKIDLVYPVLSKLCQYLCGIRTGVEVYDYGCGVGDIAIALALMGFRVRTCDLDNKLLDFARWRFARRALQIRVDVLKPPRMYPEMAEDSNDVVICQEVLEHVREPLKALERIRASLKPTGFFYTSSLFPGNLRMPGGTHLEESIKLASTETYCGRFNEMFREIGGIPGLFVPL